MHELSISGVAISANLKAFVIVLLLKKPESLVAFKQALYV